MSLTDLSSNTHKTYKNSFHWRNDSQELDVFEAARYFSAANDHNHGPNLSQKFIPQDVQRAARMSLDIPVRRNPIPPEYHVMDQKKTKENKKYKQPSSPGGRLASFLNSLFNQTSLKKKKSKSGKDFDEDQSPGGRRKRRSSISHFRITTTTTTTRATSNKSGFRTPPPYANTPTKSYKEFTNLSKNCGSLNPTLQNEKVEEKYRGKNGISERILKNEMNSGVLNRNSTSNWGDLYEKREFRKFNDVDDGAESDSSSDLFDLPNHELDFYSSGLPVYGTTHVDRIKIGAQISI